MEYICRLPLLAPLSNQSHRRLGFRCGLPKLGMTEARGFALQTPGR